MELSSKQYLRYERHIELREMGEQGQIRLLQARVLIVGAGGLGTPAAVYLAAAGIGALAIADDDVVSKSNLQRQVLYKDEDIGKLKVECLRQRLMSLNPDIKIEAMPERVTMENIGRLLENCDVVIDGSDNFLTKYLLNEHCLKYKKPLVYGAVFKFDGQVSVFEGYRAGQPCYRCLYRDSPDESVPACTEAAVFGPLVGTIGTIQAAETLKILLGLPSLLGKILVVNGLSMDFEKIQLVKNPHCPACAITQPFIDAQLPD